MTWYGAHLIEYLKYTDGAQDGYQVHENIVLIQAETLKEAFAEAKRLGKKSEVEITVGSTHRPARWIFAGVRVLVECQDVETESLDQPANFKPSHGTEVTYITLTVDSEEALAKLVKGAAVQVELLDEPPELNYEEIAELLKPYATAKSGNNNEV